MLGEAFIEISAICEVINGGEEEHFGFHISPLPDDITIDAMTDTGCQSYLAGLMIMRKFDLSSRDLIPVNMQMHSAYNHCIPVLGAATLRLSGVDESDSKRTTQQMVYITNDTDKFFLSREALCIIPDHFPVIGEVSTPAGCEAVGTDYARSHRLDCNCPKRTSPPPLPTTLLFPAIEENVARLKQYLLDCYTSITFNVCEHQPLLMMEGPPMHLMIDPKATPTVYHSSIPVPIHWQDDVKAGL